MAETMTEYEYFAVFQSYNILNEIKDTKHELKRTNDKLERIIDLLDKINEKLKR